MLHLVTTSPFQSTSLRDCLKVAQEGDAVVLLSDAVYAAATELLAGAEIHCYALTDHLQARGISTPHWLQSVDYDELVALTCQHHPIKTWA